MMTKKFSLRIDLTCFLLQAQKKVSKEKSSVPAEKTLRFLRRRPPIIDSKGQGLVEYALLLGFVAAIFIFAVNSGGFGFSGAFSGASDNIAAAGDALSSGEDTSFDYETLTDEDIGTNYKTLNWQEINLGVQAMYGTVMGSDTADKALKSEVNLFGDLSSMIDGYLASTNAADGTKDWENFLATMEKTQARNNFQSSYTRGEESIAIQRLGNSNSVQIRYTDGKNVVYYRLSPDANNVMQVETNSNKSYEQFFSTMVNSGGWSYSK